MCARVAILGPIGAHISRKTPSAAELGGGMAPQQSAARACGEWVDVGPVLEQLLDHLDMAPIGRSHQGRELLSARRSRQMLRGSVAPCEHEGGNRNRASLCTL
eukprot:998260-Prymnesium_polylepis.1